MGTNFLQRFLYRLRECIASHFTKLILHSTRNYILSWIFLGFTSLIFGAIKGIESTNPLYTTGQTWLASKDENDKMNNDVVHSATDGGEDDANDSGRA
eukprot:scaffold24838_cov157-Skeletonema_marinoi.AAC.1